MGTKRARRCGSRWMPTRRLSCCYRQHSPLLTIRAGRPALLVTLTMPADRAGMSVRPSACHFGRYRLRGGGGTPLPAPDNSKEVA